jgi:hypothetical protein
MTKVNRPPTAVTIVTRGNGWRVEQIISKAEPAGDDWKCVGARAGQFIWRRRVSNK